MFLSVNVGVGGKMLFYKGSEDSNNKVNQEGEPE